MKKPIAYSINEYFVIAKNGHEKKVYGGYFGGIDAPNQIAKELRRTMPDADISITRKVHECYAELEPSIVDICKLNASKLYDKMKEALHNVRR